MISFMPIRFLFQIAGFKVYTWGLLFVIAFLIAFFLFQREAKKKGIDEKHIYNLTLLVLLGAIIGPRLFYVLEHINLFIDNPITILTTWQGGLTSYGALLSILFAWLYTKKQKMGFSQILDILAPYLALAIFITRIGCFLNWDDIGIQSNLPWAIKVGADIARHPTQLYESFYSLATFFILIGLKKIKEKGKATKFRQLLLKQGTMFSFFLLFYSFFRFFNDFLRIYETYWLGLALSQWICIILFLISIIFLSRKPKSQITQINSPQPINLQ